LGLPATSTSKEHRDIISASQPVANPIPQPCTVLYRCAGVYRIVNVDIKKKKEETR
jgi:hypothetical protein